MKVERVQRYVLSSLACIVIMGHSMAAAVAGAFFVNGKGGSIPGLFVISVLFGTLAISAVRLINRRSVLTPWVLCALIVPTLCYLMAFAWHIGGAR